MTSTTTNTIFQNYLKECRRSNSIYKLKTYSNICIRDVEPSGFHNLPSNILLLIFKNITESELQKSVIPVCHKWRQIALMPELWHTIKFQGFHVPANFICQQLRSFTNLQCIYLIDIDDTSTIIRQICRCNTQIVKIAIKYCRNDKVDEKLSESVVRNLVATCKKLEEINLKGTLFSGHSFYIEAAVLPFLKSIDLSKNIYLTTKNIFDFILNSQKLEEFKLSYRSKSQQLSDSDTIFLFANLRTTLKSISFDMTELTDISFRTILECEKLEKLSLSNSSNMSAELFSNIWKKLPNLKYLKIHHSQMSPSDISYNFNEMNLILPNLITLNLTGSWKLNADSLEPITKKCPNLENIILKSCKNLDSIESLFFNCKNLHFVNVAFCPKLYKNNILDVPEKLLKLDKFFLDISRKEIAEEIKQIHTDLEIWIFLSEYNKTKWII